MNRCAMRIVAGDVGERIRTFRLNWLDSLTAVRVRVVKARADATYKAHGLKLMRRVVMRMRAGEKAACVQVWRSLMETAKNELKEAMAQALTSANMKRNALSQMRAILRRLVHGIIATCLDEWHTSMVQGQ